MKDSDRKFKEMQSGLKAKFLAHERDFMRKEEKKLKKETKKTAGEKQKDRWDKLKVRHAKQKEKAESKRHLAQSTARQHPPNYVIPTGAATLRTQLQGLAQPFALPRGPEPYSKRTAENELEELETAPDAGMASVDCRYHATELTHTPCIINEG